VGAWAPPPPPGEARLANAPPPDAPLPVGGRRRDSAVWVLLAVLVATVPRIVSLAADPLWVEDDAYLNCALAMARGEVPYHDFVHPHTPLLEWFTAAYLSVTGPSVNAVLFATQLVVLVLTALVALVGLRLGGPRTAAVAAALTATSPLLWRYRLFHRELFLALLVVAAVAILVSSRRNVGRAAAIAVLLAAAVLVKLTALPYAIAILAAILLDRSWGPRAAAWVAGVLVATVGTALGAFAAAFGRPFVAQAILFGAQHPGFEDPWLKISIVSHDLVPLLVAALAGVTVLVLAGAGLRWLPALLPLLLGGLFVLVLKPVGWGHNVLELLPWSALAVAAASDLAVRHVCPRWERRTLVAAVAALVALSAAWFWWGPSPRGPSRWVSRSEIGRLSHAVREVAPPDGRVFVPSLVAFAAGRRELVINPEIAAWSRALTDAVSTRGVVAVAGEVGALRRRPYFATVDRSLARTADAAVAAVRRQEIAVVATPVDITRSPVFPFGLEPRLLGRSGYHPVEVGRRYVLWAPIPVGGVETPARRP